MDNSATVRKGVTKFEMGGGGGGSVREWNSRAGAYRHRFLTPSALSKRGASGRGASGGKPLIPTEIKFNRCTFVDTVRGCQCSFWHSCRIIRLPSNKPEHVVLALATSKYT